MSHALHDCSIALVLVLAVCAAVAVASVVASRGRLVSFGGSSDESHMRKAACEPTALHTSDSSTSDLKAEKGEEEEKEKEDEWSHAKAQRGA